MNRSQLLTCLLIATLLLGGFSVTSSAAEEPLVSMVFVQDDLRDAITELVLQTGINIIVDDSVHGLVTLDLIDVPLEQALRMMTIAGGFEVHKLDGFYFIGSSNPNSSSYRSFAETETYQLKYIEGRNLAELIPEMYQQYIRTSTTSNIVTITAPPTIMKEIRDFLDLLDNPAPQILVQALVTEISRAELDEWGMGLLSYTPQQATALGAEVAATTDNNDSWLDNIIYENSVFEFGFFGEVLASLRALEADQKAEIRANPRVLASSGQTVDLFSGETHFLLLSSDANASRRMEEVDVGVSLNVTPTVIDGSTMRLSISPEISHLSERPLNNNEGFSVRRSAVTTDVYAQNGQTLLLAGMTLQQTTNRDSRVPVLGKIPVIRWLFTDKYDVDEERELLIFVTAEIL